MNQKRVYCLYRVSTVGQVEQDDIPMQRQYCREFIERNPEWVLTNELYEKGISGFKVSAKERDAIQEMQRDAVQGKFEILLVYMFDRLCRKEKTMGFFMKSLLLSFSFLCNEEICSISSNLIIARPFLPSAVNVALASTVPCK